MKKKKALFNWSGGKDSSIALCRILQQQDFAGRVIDHDFIKDLSNEIDPCGENGEFHTFVFDGPLFSKQIEFKIGDIVYREYKAPDQVDDQCGLSDELNPNKMGFWFCELESI